MTKNEFQDRLSRIDTGIYRWTAPEIETIDSINFCFANINQMVKEDHPKHFAFVLDIRACEIPEFEVQKHIKQQFKKMPRRPDNIVYVTGKNFLVNSVALAVVKSIFGSKVSIHKTLESGMAEARNPSPQKSRLLRGAKIFNTVDNKLALPLAIALSLFIVALPIILLVGFETLTSKLEMHIHKNRLQNAIEYHDEVLTMSARMAAFTGDIEWERRYQQHEQLLDQAIDQLLNLQKGTDDQHFANFLLQTDKANTELIKIESKAFSLARNGSLRESQSLLLSQNYRQLKQQYSEGIHKSKQNSLASLTQKISNHGKFKFAILVAWIVLLGIWIFVALFLRMSRNRQSYLSEKREEAEQQMLQTAKLASIGELAAGVGHEILNPAAIIRGNLRLLRRSDPSETKELCDKIDVAVERIISIVDGLRIYSRAEEKDQEISNIHECILSTLDLVSSVHSNSGIRFTTELSASRFDVEIDYSRFQQVIMNLISNAVHAMEDRDERKLSITTRNVEEALVIVVADTGCGIPSESLDKIFQPFYTTKGRGKGTGIGMGTILKIVNDADGEINVASTAGKGTKFTIELPTKTANLKSPEPVAVQETSSTSCDTSFNALIVEDEPELRSLLRFELEEFGMTVSEAADGAKGFAAIQKQSFDVVMTDLQMPEMFGDELIAQCRKQGLNQPVYVLVTGDVHVDEKDQLADVIIRKPYNPEEIRAVIELLTQRKAA